MSQKPAQLRLNVILQKQGECWVARCPELDALAADQDFETAWEDIVRVCRAQLTYGLKKGHSLASLLRPAPANIAEIMAQATMDGHLTLHIDSVVVGDECSLQVLRMVA